MATFNGSTWHFFDTFRLWEGDGTIDMDTDELWVTLHTSAWTPDKTKSLLTDLTNEVANGAGGIYVTGGQKLTSVTFAQQGPTTPEQVKLAAANAAWAVSSGSMAAMYAVIHNHAAATRNGHANPLVAYCSLDDTTVPGTPTTVTTSSGQTLAVSSPSGIYIKLGGN